MYPDEFLLLMSVCYKSAPIYKRAELESVMNKHGLSDKDKKAVIAQSKKKSGRCDVQVGELELTFLF